MIKLNKNNLKKFIDWLNEEYEGFPEYTFGVQKYQGAIDLFSLDTANILYESRNNKLLVNNVGGFFLESKKSKNDVDIYYISSPLSLLSLASNGLSDGYLLISGFNYFINNGWNPKFEDIK